MEAKLPEYAAQPIRGFLDYWDESQRLLHLSMQGISSLRGMPGLIEALADDDSEQHGETNSRALSLEQARAAADFAKKEVESGFPLLHAHTLVGMWGALEAALEDVLIGILINEPKILEQDAFARVRISLADFERLDKDERMRHLLGELERSQNSSRRHGVDHFEALLGLFSLSGDVDRDTKKTIWEMNHVRNVIVHRGSVADRKLIEACPWLGLNPGDKVKVTHEMLGRYGGALSAYTLAIAYRLGERYNVDIRAKVERALTSK